MTVQVDIFALIILVGVIIFMAFLLPMVWQMKKAAQETDAILGELRRELIPALQDVREITQRVNRTSVKIENSVENAAYLILGLKAASKVFIKGTQQKGD